jgi:hypothetical protein
MPNPLRIFGPAWAAAVAVVSAIAVVSGYLLTARDVVRLGLPIPIWQAIAAAVFFVMLGVMFYQNGPRSSSPPPPLPIPIYKPEASLPPSVATNDGRGWLRESPQEMMQLLSIVPPLKRRAVADASFAGRWVRWKGKVSHINSSPDDLWLSVSVHQGGSALLNFSRSELPLIEHLHEGDTLEFEGMVKAVLPSGSTDLYSIRLL